MVILYLKADQNNDFLYAFRYEFLAKSLAQKV